MQTFASRDHTASVKCIAIHKHLLASGGSDDKIFIYDMNKRTLLQVLTFHEGTVNTLAFSPDGHFLLSGGADGKVFVTKIGSWITEKNWKSAHDGKPVLCLAIHPTGKLALTLGGDLTLRTWDLLKGRCVFITNLKTKSNLGKYIEFVDWSIDGTHFAMLGTNAVEIWAVKSASIVVSRNFKTRPSCLCWISNEGIFVGFENGEVLFINVDGESVQTKCSDKRIKSLKMVNDKVAIITSGGDVSLWNIDDSKTLEMVASVNIGCRPTCLNFVDGSFLKRVVNNVSENVKVNSELGSEEANKTKSFKSSLRSVEIEIEQEVTDDTLFSSSDHPNASTPFKKFKKRKRTQNSDSGFRESSFISEILGSPQKKKKKLDKNVSIIQNQSVEDKSYEIQEHSPGQKTPKTKFKKSKKHSLNLIEVQPLVIDEVEVSEKIEPDVLNGNKKPKKNKNKQTINQTLPPESIETSLSEIKKQKKKRQSLK